MKKLTLPEYKCTNTILYSNIITICDSCDSSESCDKSDLNDSSDSSDISDISDKKVIKFVTELLSSKFF